MAPDEPPIKKGSGERPSTPPPGFPQPLPPEKPTPNSTKSNVIPFPGRDFSGDAPLPDGPVERTLTGHIARPPVVDNKGARVQPPEPHEQVGAPPLEPPEIVRRVIEAEVTDVEARETQRVEAVEPHIHEPAPPGFGGYATPPNRKKKVAIVGFASSSRDAAPFKDPSFEIWGMNEIYKMLPRLSRLFEMHTWEHLQRERVRGDEVIKGEDHLNWMRQNKSVIIYMQKARQEIPRSQTFPLEGLSRLFLPGREPYFMSTPAYMLALAIAEGFEEIHVYGVDLLQDEEYTYQRPNMEFYIGVALGRGIKMYVHEASALLRSSYLYGWTEPPDEGSMAPLVSALGSETERMRTGYTELSAKMNVIAGSIQTLESVSAWLKHHSRGGVIGARPGEDVKPFALKTGVKW